MKPDFNQRKAQANGDTLPEQANVYVPPRPLAQMSDHRTMDIKAIRIAAELDPRQAKTQLRLQAPPRRRHGLKLFAAGALVVGVLIGAATYVMLMGEQPLPLVTADPGVTPPAPTPTPESEPSARLVSPRSASLAAPTELPTALAPPATASPAVSVSASAPRPPVAAPHVAPKKTKITRDPWLE
jgi:hypothetical protein